MGLSGNHPERIKAAILYTIESTCLSEGHTYIETKRLIINTQTLLNQSAEGGRVTEMDAADGIIALGESKDIVIEGERRYFPSLFYAEQNVANACSTLRLRRSMPINFLNRNFCLHSVNWKNG